MSENQELEREIIPAETLIKPYEDSKPLLEDTLLDATIKNGLIKQSRLSKIT